jgi:putative resolvase
MTAWRRASEGRIEGAFRNDAGRWMVEIDDPETETVAYARVCSHDQKSDLDRKIARIAEWAAANDIKIDRFVREVGSGLNDQRKQLTKLLRDPSCVQLFVEHRERLARFGVHEFEHALAACGRRIRVVDDKEIDDDRVRDMIEVITYLPPVVTDVDRPGVAQNVPSRRWTVRHDPDVLHGHLGCHRDADAEDLLGPWAWHMASLRHWAARRRLSRKPAGSCRRDGRVGGRAGCPRFGGGALLLCFSPAILRIAAPEPSPGCGGQSAGGVYALA